MIIRAERPKTGANKVRVLGHTARENAIKATGLSAQQIRELKPPKPVFTRQKKPYARKDEVLTNRARRFRQPNKTGYVGFESVGARKPLHLMSVGERHVLGKAVNKDMVFQTLYDRDKVKSDPRLRLTLDKWGNQILVPTKDTLLMNTMLQQQQAQTVAQQVDAKVDTGPAERYVQLRDQNVRLVRGTVQTHIDRSHSSMSLRFQAAPHLQSAQDVVMNLKTFLTPQNTFRVSDDTDVKAPSTVSKQDEEIRGLALLLLAHFYGLLIPDLNVGDPTLKDFQPIRKANVGRHYAVIASNPDILEAVSKAFLQGRSGSDVGAQLYDLDAAFYESVKNHLQPVLGLFGLEMVRDFSLDDQQELQNALGNAIVQTAEYSNEAREQEAEKTRNLMVKIYRDQLKRQSAMAKALIPGSTTQTPTGAPQPPQTPASLPSYGSLPIFRSPPAVPGKPDSPEVQASDAMYLNMQLPSKVPRSTTRRASMPTLSPQALTFTPEKTQVPVIRSDSKTSSPEEMATTTPVGSTSVVPSPQSPAGSPQPPPIDYDVMEASRNLRMFLPFLEAETEDDANLILDTLSDKIHAGTGYDRVDEAARTALKVITTPRTETKRSPETKLLWSAFVVNYYEKFRTLYNRQYDPSMHLPKMYLNPSGTIVKFEGDKDNLTWFMINLFIAEVGDKLLRASRSSENLKKDYIRLKKDLARLGAAPATPSQNIPVSLSYDRKQEVVGSGNDIADAIPMVQLIADSLNTKKRRKRNQQTKAIVDRLMEKGVITKRKQYKHGHMGRRIKRRRKTQSLTELLA